MRIFNSSASEGHAVGTTRRVRSSSLHLRNFEASNSEPWYKDSETDGIFLIPLQGHPSENWVAYAMHMEELNFSLYLETTSCQAG
jgi:hypothetical protein